MDNAIVSSVSTIVLRNNWISEAQKGGETTFFLLNKGRSSEKIRVFLNRKSDNVFLIKKGSDESFLAAGMSKPIILNYTPSDNVKYTGQIEVFVRDKLNIIIPITLLPMCSYFELNTPEIDFGIQVNEHQFITKQFQILNSGDLEGCYKVMPHLIPHVRIYPISGKLKPNRSQTITIELLCKDVGTITEAIRFDVDNADQPNVSVKIKYSMMRRSMQILDPHNTSIQLSRLSFNNVYYGSVVSRKVILHNNSPICSDYICAVDENMSDMNHSLVTCTQKSKDTYAAFQFPPEQGTLKPYEKRAIEFKFAPKVFPPKRGWRKSEVQVIQCDYSMLVKFMLIGLNGNIMKDAGFSLVSLSASAVPVEITVSPDKALNFGSCQPGSIVTKKIEVTNLSDVLPIKFRCQDVAHYKCHPCTGTINKGSALTFELLFQPKQLGSLNFELIINFGGPQSNVLRNGTAIYTVAMDLKGSGIATYSKKHLTSFEIAKPNDLAGSIRPWPQDKKKVLTAFTKVPRYSYTDLDYCGTREECRAKESCKNQYTSYLRQKRCDRLWKKKEKRLSNDNEVDLGIIPACGLRSPTVTGVNNDLQDPTNHSACQVPNACTRMNSRDLEYHDSCLVQNSIIKECRERIPLDELNRICIEPSSLQFGSVVIDSVVKKVISVKNYTSRRISIKLDMCGSQVTCTKFPGSNIIVIILNPHSYTKFQFQVKKSRPENVEGSLKMEINEHHTYYIPVYAAVNELSLDLSSNTVTLCEPPYSNVNAGLWGSIELSNKHDVPISFKWCMKDGSNTFFALQTSGVIPANKNLICGFGCLPFFNSPSSAHCELHIEGSIDQYVNFITICLTAKIESARCIVQQRRVLFGTIPSNLISSQSLHIVNRSDSHAYFKAPELKTDLNINVTPSNGCVPAGGIKELLINVRPEKVGPFNIKLCISVRESQPLIFRVTGIVEHPMISVEKDVFDFGGVLCGSKSSLPYVITNRGSCRVELMFNLTHLQDFTLVLPKEYCDVQDRSAEGSSRQLMLKLPSKSSANCILHFQPHEVAAYDSFLTVLVNGTQPRSPPASPWPPSKMHTSLCITEDLNGSFSNTPTRRIIATALLSPLLVINSEIVFSLHPDSLNEPVMHDKKIHLINVSNEALTWTLDLSQSDCIKDKIFQFVRPFSSDCPSLLQSDTPCCLKPEKECSLGITFCPIGEGCSFEANIPLLLNGNSIPYCELSLSAILPLGTISANPGHIIMHPIPLEVILSAEFMIIMEGFSQLIDLDVSLPLTEDYLNLVVKFPNGSQFSNFNELRFEIPCILEFSSTQPASKSDILTFTERKSGIMTEVPFTVSSDNSMFSVFDFFSQNLDNAAIKLNENSVPIYQFLEDSVNPYGSGVSISSATTISTNMNYKQMYLQDCVLAVCRWISLYGGPGISHLNTPTDFCVRVKEDFSKSGHKQRSSINSSRGMLLDMLNHLCGRLPPGIPLNLPPCTSISEKNLQQYSTYDVVLTFIKNQGGILSSVVPEILLDYQDYLQCIVNKFCPTSYPMDEVKFSDVSNKAWSSVLMQIIKVLVLPRLLKQGSPNKVRKLSSNIYSALEGNLLLWLNQHYKMQKDILFDIDAPTLLSQIINFDVDLMDGIVLACVLYSFCPFLKNTHFIKLFNKPSSPEQCAHNAIIIIRALKFIGIDYDVQQNDICSPNPIFMILLCAHLYYTLPKYNPIDTLKFLVAMTKTEEVKIKVHNRSVKDMKYAVLIRGENMNSFSSSSYISISGRSCGDLTVFYHCTSISPANAYIYLVAQGRQPISSTISYSLFGCSTGVKPKAQKKITTPLYELFKVAITVTSPVKSIQNFKISLYESDEYIPSKSRKGYSSESPIFIPATSLQKRSDDGINLFHCYDNFVDLDPDVPSMITVQFVPLKYKPRHCSLVLSNDVIGDIVFSILASVNKPVPTLPETLHRHPRTIVNPSTRTLHINAYSDTTVKEDVVIINSNKAFENALLEISKWELTEDELKWRVLSDSPHYAALLSSVNKLQLKDYAEIHNYGDNERIPFAIEGSDSKHFSFPHQLLVSKENKGTTILPVEFHAEREGQYECHIHMASGYDVRTFVIESTVLAKERLAQIEFKTQAVQPLTQNIPVVNPSTSDWPLTASISNPQFIGPDTFLAGALTTACYPLTFNPQSEGSLEGELKLTNSVDSSEHTYKLIGIAERPLALDCIKLHTTVKQRMTHTIYVPNCKDKTVVFHAKSDLDFISGPTDITIGGHDVKQYPLTIIPKTHGKFSGALMFIVKTTDLSYSSGTADENKLEDYHIWYQVECTVDRAPPDHTIFISCPALGVKNEELSIINPLNEEVTLKVKIDGEYLSGPDILVLQPLEKSSYAITYYPMLVGKFNGRITFYGLVDGEVWYQLNLEGLNPKETYIPHVECEIGRYVSQSVTLKNPLDALVRLTCNNSNTEQYTVTGLAEGTIDVPPFSKSDMQVVFRPSYIGSRNNSAELTFISREFGKQVFILQGNGLLPSTMDTTTLVANINSTAVHIITFMNPLKSEVNISVYLNGRDSDQFCSLLKKASKILLHQKESIDIPIMFAPQKLCCHEVTVSIVAHIDCDYGDQCKENCGGKHNFCWKYPINGLPELKLCNLENAPRIKCSAKERQEQIIEVSLVELVNTSTPRCFNGSDNISLGTLLDSGKYTWRLLCLTESYLSLVDQSVGLQLLGEVNAQEGGYVILYFKLIFSPSKAFRCVCNLIINNSEGGQWTLPLKFTSVTSSPDDIITIEAAGLNKEARVAFRLSSTTMKPVSFTAHLVNGSDREISISPMRGTLAPCNSEGTLFVVTYKPTTYGRKHHAKVIVQSDASEWCYEIIGKIPSYSLPSRHFPMIMDKKKKLTFKFGGKV